MTSPDSIVLRDINELAEMREIERLQKTIWGVEDLDVLPSLALRPLVEVGAILIGAFERERMVGFVFGFPGRIKNENVIHSDMLGVLPEYRSFSLGYRLKLAQRERAMSLGINNITWTFDPLRAVNARLNFSRLAVIANRYEIDYYGDTSSVLHRLGTDRLWVTWRLHHERTVARIEAKTAPPGSNRLHIPALVRVGEMQQPISGIELTANQVLIEIPTALDELLKNKPQLASAWRMATREAFTSALGAGYVVEDFCLDRDQGKGAYVLRQSV